MFRVLYGAMWLLYWCNYSKITTFTSMYCISSRKYCLRGSKQENHWFLQELESLLLFSCAIKIALSYVDFIRGALGLFCMFTFVFLIFCKNFSSGDMLKLEQGSSWRKDLCLWRDWKETLQGWFMRAGPGCDVLSQVSTTVEHTGLSFESRKTHK